MSGNLHIRFASDMPTASVEVISPTLETVGRVWIEPGGTADIDVPSEASFLRVYMPSGEIVTMHDPGNLNRRIDLDSLLKRKGRRVIQKGLQASQKDFFALERINLPEEDEGFTPSSFVDPLQPRFATFLTGEINVRLIGADKQPLPGIKSGDTETVRFSGFHSMAALDLIITTPTHELSTRLPGLLAEASVSILKSNEGLRLVSVRARMENREANTLGGYLSRGDFQSAATMSTWFAERAEELLEGKMHDPFAATLGAYLLLRLRRFDLMHRWARNLANFFPKLADGNVIWAWQQIHQGGGQDEIREYLVRAASADALPVFTEGLKLLRDGLRLLGREGKKLQKKVNSKAGVILWDSPFTSVLRTSSNDPEKPVKFEIGYSTEL
jgi:hypothetical protein